MTIYEKRSRHKTIKTKINNDNESVNTNENGDDKKFYKG